MTIHYTLTVLLGAATVLSGQIVAPMGIVRGDLVKWTGTNSGGELEIRGSDAAVVTCGFDAKTYFERDNQRVAAGAMTAGDRIELVADRKAGAVACYARTVHVIDPTVQRRVLGSRYRRESPNPTESFAPRGDLTFAGVVIRINADSVLLKTRTGEHQRLLLRSDTRYLGEGMRVEPSQLKTSTRVFVRAGKNLEGEVEAYQIVWGAIMRTP